MNDANGSRDRARLRKYLLDQLPETETEEIELALLSDDELYELMLAVEEELIDDCVRGELVDAEAKHFFRYLGRLSDGRDRYQLAEAIADASRAETSFHRPPRRRAAPAGLQLERLALAALALALLLVSVLSGSRIWRLSSELDALRGERESHVLAPGVLRGAGSTQTVTISGDELLVELDLDLPSDPYETYRAVLNDAEGAELLVLGGLASRSGDRRTLLTLPVPAMVLSPGDYYVVLRSGDDSPEAAQVVARYDFRVRVD